MPGVLAVHLTQEFDPVTDPASLDLWVMSGMSRRDGKPDVLLPAYVSFASQSVRGA